ncbi:arginine/serine-rich coiled-coil protein 2-like isoform X2 [Ipomoea triloba]|nr:arginine/serine-rich coiled-coil protein 2-like isoform X2 [Ipomoea triloba]
MTADQKKKLLWGSKKNTTNSEESAHCWDTSTFGDCERQEKFNKLMGVKGNMKMENKPGTQDAEKQKELQMDLEKQYTAGLRRRDGRTVGLGL